MRDARCAMRDARRDVMVYIINMLYWACACRIRKVAICIVLLVYWNVFCDKSICPSVMTHVFGLRYHFSTIPVRLDVQYLSAFRYTFGGANEIFIVLYRMPNVIKVGEWLYADWSDLSRTWYGILPLIQNALFINRECVGFCCRWYKVNWAQAETLFFGYHRGCTFAQESCKAYMESRRQA